MRTWTEATRGTDVAEENLCNVTKVTIAKCDNYTVKLYRHKNDEFMSVS